jgi:6-phosphogluconolactonase
MKRFPLLLVVTFFVFGCYHAAGQTQTTTFLVGTYTDNPEQGINQVSLNQQTNALTLQKIIDHVDNPSFIITNKLKSIVVIVEETAGDKGGKITSYAITGKDYFTKRSTFFTQGNHPCTLAFSPDEKYVVVGNYSGGNLSVFPIDGYGALSESVTTYQHTGTSEHVSRQEKPHVHSVVFHPKQNKLFVADLGNDSIECIPFDSNSDTFLKTEEAVATKVPPGSGPRHLIFDAKGETLFATFELSNQVGVFRYKNNQLQLIQLAQITDSTKSGTAAEIKLSKDNKYVYASVRGDDNFIAVYGWDAEKLTLLQKVPTKKGPRNFIFTDDESLVLVGSQFENSISVFKRDKKTGLLTATSSELPINKPVYFCKF